MKDNKKITLTKKKKKIIYNNFKKSQKGQGISLPVKLLAFFSKFVLRLGFKYPTLLFYPIIHYLTFGKLLPNSYYKIFTKVPTKIFETIIQELKKKGFFHSRNIKNIKDQLLKNKEILLTEYKDANNQTKKDEIKNNKLIPELDIILNDIEGFIKEINQKKIEIVKEEIELEVLKYNQKKGNKYNVGDNPDTIRDKIKILTSEIQYLESVLLIHQYFYQSWILDNPENLNILNKEEKKKFNNNFKEILDQKDLDSNLVSERIKLGLVKKATRVPYHHLLSNIKKTLNKVDPNSIIYLLYLKLRIPFFIIGNKFSQELFEPSGNLKTIDKKKINQSIAEKLEEQSINNAKNLLSKLGIEASTDSITS